MNSKIIGIVVAVIVVAGGGLYLVSHKDEKDEYKKTTDASMEHKSKTDETPAKSNVASDSSSVTIKNFAFDKPLMSIKKGTTVTWKNEDSAPHTATANDGSFDSKNLSTGNSFSFKFEKAGTFDYHCTIHPSMKASVVVTE